MDSALKKQILQCRSFIGLSQLLRGHDQRCLGPHDIDFIYHAIVKTKLGPEYASYKVAYLANHTVDALSRYCAVHGVFNGMLIDAYIGPYSQYAQEILNPESGLYKFEPDLIFLSLIMEVLSPRLAKEFLSLSESERKGEADKILSEVATLLENLREKTGAMILVSNFVRPPSVAAGLADLKMRQGESEFYAKLNLDLLELFRRDRRVYMLDMEHIMARHGKGRSIDYKMYHLAKLYWSESFLPELASEILKYSRAALGHTKKCLVLDLDNTLWGGVIGEDGIHGVSIGHGDAVGEAHLDFQYAIKCLQARGILLAVCSKNNQQDVDQLFAERNDMPLKKDDFASMQINWEHKYINIQHVANELNIGLDSLVFVDDNPAECVMVSKALPEVRVLHLKGDPSGYSELLLQMPEFEKLHITAEDREKNIQYQQNKRRDQVRRSFENVEDYLASLGTRVLIEEAKAGDVPRLHQLFTKTNQFNVTTKRYVVSEIEEFIRHPDWMLCAVTAKDNFGDMGMIGLVLVYKQCDKAYIDSFVISCRALGRGIESFVMNAMKKKYLESGSCATMQARFVRTKKNKPAENFFEEQGFSLLSENETEKCYELSARSCKYINCPGIHQILSEEL